MDLEHDLFSFIFRQKQFERTPERLNWAVRCMLGSVGLKFPLEANKWPPYAIKLSEFQDVAYPFKLNREPEQD
jgi:hypothetical protein